MRPGGTIVLLFLVLVLVDPARADEAAVRLVHERGRGAESCPDETAFRAATIERLHYDPFSDDGPRTLRLSVVEDGGLFRGTVRLEGVAGQILAERRLASPDCGDLTETIVLAMAIALDPLAEVREPTAGVPVVTVTARPTAARPRARSAPDPLLWYAALAGLTAVGVRPGIAPGAALEAGVGRRGWRLALDLRTFLPATVEVQGGRVTASSSLAMALACSRLGRLSFCASVLGGALYAYGHDDLVRPRTLVVPQVGVGQRIAWDQPLTRRLGVRFQIDGGGWLVRARLTVGQQDAWAEPAGWASAAVTVVETFP